MTQTQLQRLAELNTQFFICVTRLLGSIDDYCRRYHLSIPNDPKIDYLIEQALCLISEINGTNINNRQLTGRNTNREDNRACLAVLLPLRLF